MSPGLTILDLCCNIHRAGSEFDVNNMKSWLRPVFYQAAVGGLMVWGMFS